jgi:hypothetical protein
MYSRKTKIQEILKYQGPFLSIDMLLVSLSGTSALNPHPGINPPHNHPRLSFRISSEAEACCSRNPKPWRPKVLRCNCTKARASRSIAIAIAIATLLTSTPRSALALHCTPLLHAPLRVSHPHSPSAPLPRSSVSLSLYCCFNAFHF